MWRGSLLPLGREAAPRNGTAAQSSGSKLPRHRFCARPALIVQPEQITQPIFSSGVPGSHWRCLRSA
nr:hypothetical protein C1892_15605 [Pseudomonas sp. MPBD7-1]